MEFTIKGDQEWNEKIILRRHSEFNINKSIVLECYDLGIAERASITLSEIEAFNLMKAISNLYIAQEITGENTK
jgi:hypothetical protein